MSKDSLGDRQKMYEGMSATRLIPKMPVVMRLDGKAFHSFTRGLDRPYDERFHRCMWMTAQALCREIQGAQVAYVQSDEITILVTDWATFNTSSWFDNRVQKMCSVAASIASGYFIMAYLGEFEIGPEDMTRVPAFDCRVWNLPRHEVVNSFIWRQQDATRNSIQMLGQANFSQRQLHGVSCNEIQDMLMTQKGINWNDCPIPQKRGVCIVKKADPETGRTSWQVDTEIPIFTQDRAYIEQYLTEVFWKEVPKGVVKYPAVVEGYHDAHMRGVAKLEDGQLVPFHSTNFYAGRVTRPPRAGESVQIALEDKGEDGIVVHGVWATS